MQISTYAVCTSLVTLAFDLAYQLPCHRVQAPECFGDGQLPFPAGVHSHLHLRHPALLPLWRGAAHGDVLLHPEGALVWAWCLRVYGVAMGSYTCSFALLRFWLEVKERFYLEQFLD